MIAEEDITHPAATISGGPAVYTVSAENGTGDGGIMPWFPKNSSSVADKGF